MSKVLVIHPMKKVAFGTPEFIWLRQSINEMCELRRLLSLYFEDNEVLVRSLTRMIRYTADLVYFKPKTFMPPDKIIYPFPTPRVKEVKPAKKGKAKRPIQNTPRLF